MRPYISGGRQSDNIFGNVDELPVSGEWGTAIVQQLLGSGCVEHGAAI